MKSVVKCSFLLISIFTLLGCAQSPSSSASVVNTSYSSTSSSSSEMEQGVNAEEYETKANAINKVEYKTATITFSIREKTTGVYPNNKADGNPMEPDVEVTSSLVIQDNGSGMFNVVSGGVSSEISNIKGGANLYL